MVRYSKPLRLMILEAMKALGGERSISEVYDWIDSHYPDEDASRSSVSTSMADLSLNGPPSSLYPMTERFLWRVRRGVYRLATSEDSEFVRKGRLPCVPQRIEPRIKREMRKPEEEIFYERKVLEIVVEYLKDNAWMVEEKVKIDGGFVDIIANKDGETFLVEAKGEDKGGYTSAEMNFQMGLGQLMSRMKYAEANYGLAFPLTRDFVKVLQKYQDSFSFQKLGIYLLPVEKNGTCRIISPSNVLKFFTRTVE